MKKTADNYVYILDGKAYINLTNRCENACEFCIRNTGDGVAGSPLWLEREPSAGDVLSAFERVKNALSSREVVFCGFGEPTQALDVLKEVAAALKQSGYTVRLNTNGLGSLSHGRDISVELKNVDTVSVSLNEFDAQSYAKITRSKYGDKAFPAVLSFAKRCKSAGIDTVFTVVDTIGKEDIEKARELCEYLQIPLRVRKYISDNYGDGE